MCGEPMEPLVSVIMPVFNSEKYLLDSVKSVLEQSFMNLELIIIDNNSNDSSADMIANYCNSDSRIISLRCLESGPAYARNLGIKKAGGRYIAFLDSDDIWLKDKLKLQIEFMLSNEYAFTHTNYEEIIESGEKTGRIIGQPSKLSYEDLLKSCQIGCLTAIYDTHVIGKHYMPLIKKRQDYALWLSILKQHPYAYCLPEVLALYRVHSSGSVSSNKLLNVKYNWQLFRNVEKFSIVLSSYYVAWNILRKVFRRFR